MKGGGAVPGNVARFLGFASLYDRARPSPPASLGALLASYAGTARPAVVDLGSGTGLSSRWAATWAASVVGVEPNADMRSQACSSPVPGVGYREGTAQRTGLPAASADVVVAVQSFHWMPPEPTLVEVARLLRPGGVFAAIDADWPPVVGITAAEAAWSAAYERMHALEKDLALGEADRARRWDKAAHLAQLAASGRFTYTREVVLDGPGGSGADRFVDLLRSQGTYQTLQRAGLGDGAEVVELEQRVRRALDGADPAVQIRLSWRARLGMTAR